MRHLALLLAMCAASLACAPRTGTGGSGGAPPLEKLHYGLWSGEAGKSPLGKQPYAIVFRKTGTTVIAETPPMLGEEHLPPGAYQLFEFPEGLDGPRGTFRTSMGSAGLLDGELRRDATRSSRTKAIFCEAGNCGSMELRWESLTAESMSFQVWLDGVLHVDILLAFDGEMS